MKCRNCKKALKPGMEIEYSAWLCEAFCSPDCATTYYYDVMGSRPVEDFAELERLLYVAAKLEENNYTAE